MTLTWPSADGLERWLRAQLTEASSSDEVHLSGLDHIRIHTDVTGADITSLRVDASDVTLRVQLSENAADDTSAASGAPDAPSEQPEQPDADVVESIPGMLHQARILADPLIIERIPLHLDATMSDLPISWDTYAHELHPGDPTSRFMIRPREEGASSRGTLEARMRTADIGRLIRVLADPPLAAGGVRLRRLSITVDQASSIPAEASTDSGTDTDTRRETDTDAPNAPTPDDILAVTAITTARWKAFGVRLRADATVAVERAGFVTMTSFRLSSRNLLVALALRAFRSQLEELEGIRHDLNAGREGGPRLHDLRVRTGADLTVSARLG